MPSLAVDLAWSEDDGALTVTVEQTQRLDADNPAYAFSLPLYLKFGDSSAEGGRARYIYIDTDARRAESRFRLPARPAEVTIDPNMTVLADYRIRTPLDPPPVQ
jgi:hypothetical protein